MNPRAEGFVGFVIAVDLTVIYFEIAASHDVLRVHIIFNDCRLEPFDYLIPLANRQPTGLELTMKFRCGVRLR